MSQRRLTRSQIETIVPNPIRNHNFDFARLGDSFTGVSNTVTGVSPNFFGEEFIERWYFHAKGPAVFSISRVEPALDTRLNHLNEIGNFHYALRIEVTTAAALGPDDYYLLECYFDGGDVRGMNWGAGALNDPNFQSNDANPQESNMAGASMISWKMRSNIEPGSGIGGNYINPGVDDPHFHFSLIDEYNAQSFVTQISAGRTVGNHGPGDAGTPGGTSPDNYQWSKQAGLFRGIPILTGPVSGVPPAVVGGTNDWPLLAPGRRIMRWGLGLSGGTNLRLANQSEEGTWGYPSAIDRRFLASSHTGRHGVLGQPVEDFTTTVGNFIEIASPFMEAGLGHSRIAPTEHAVEKMQCEKFLQTSYQTGVVPGTAAATGGRVVTESSGHNSAGFTMKHYVRLSPSMVNLPTITVYSPVTGTANRVRINGVDVTPDSIEVFEDGFIVEATGGASTTRNMEFHFVARADLI